MSEARESAGLGRRLAATAYEIVLLSGVIIAVGFALLPWFNPSPPEQGTLRILSPGARAISFALVFAACGAYCVGLWSGGRRTLAMKTWRLELRTPQGAPVGARRALMRYLACWIAPGCAIAAYVALRPFGYARWALAALAVNHAWALVDPTRQFLQDRIAGTRLLRRRASRPA